MKNTKQIVGNIVYHYRYIVFPNNIILKNVKIISANARNSTWYIKYPYILRLTYAKEWTEETTSTMFVNGMPITTTSCVYHSTKEYTFKYESIDDIAEKIREMRDNHIDVKNDLKSTSQHQ